MKTGINYNTRRLIEIILRSYPSYLQRKKILGEQDARELDTINKRITAIEKVCAELNQEEKKVISRRYWQDSRITTRYESIPCNYSERQMHRITQKVIRRLAQELGEII